MVQIRLPPSALATQTAFSENVFWARYGFDLLGFELYVPFTNFFPLGLCLNVEIYYFFPYLCCGVVYGALAVLEIWDGIPR